MRGFTIIEGLVVIALMAVVICLAIGVYNQVVPETTPKFESGSFVIIKHDGVRGMVVSRRWAAYHDTWEYEIKGSSGKPGQYWTLKFNEAELNPAPAGASEYTPETSITGHLLTGD